MASAFLEQVECTLAEIRDAGLHKPERVLASAQDGRVVCDGRSVVNLCANNYLGLANHPAVVDAARAALDRWGHGLASVRFICGTQELHRELEAALARFLGMEDCILYPSCFDANGGLFETLLGPEDAVVSDALNHASIIDGVRLSKARRFRYANDDLADLEARLAEARAGGARHILITTDGVFSMDGTIARLDAIRALADRFDALVHVDECHATGFLGTRGRGTPEFRGVHGRLDIITGTLGKALGGGSGGFTAAAKPVVDLLRQRSRPYLFSNSVPPPIVAGALAALRLVEASTKLRDRLAANTVLWRTLLEQRGLPLLPGAHPIVPVMLGDAVVAQRLAARLLELGVYVTAFSYPVVPQGRARIRTQVSAAHTEADLLLAADAFAQAHADIRG